MEATRSVTEGMPFTTQQPSSVMDDASMKADDASAATKGILPVLETKPSVAEDTYSVVEENKSVAD